MHTQPSVFAYSVVFGGAIGTALFSALSLPSGTGFLVGTSVLFFLLSGLVVAGRVARSRQMLERHYGVCSDEMEPWLERMYARAQRRESLVRMLLTIIQHGIGRSLLGMWKVLAEWLKKPR